MLENPEYFSEQLITYIGNKRALLEFISTGLDFVKKKLKKDKLSCVELFSGSGVVSRFLKGSSNFLAVNDLEYYARVISECYLANKSELPLENLHDYYDKLIESSSEMLNSDFAPGFISELYAPKNQDDVKLGERCFYTTYNAHYIDIIRQNIDLMISEKYRSFFIAPLLSECSVHANTSGVFKGFYKNSQTGKGQFGGNGRNALSRICANIELPFPVFSNNECPVKVYQQDANALVQDSALYEDVPGGVFDLAYLDPPYNQHPYGSNYFMLNLVAKYERPDESILSKVSGIPKGWNHSLYNKRRYALDSFDELIKNLKARFIMISFNNEGFIPRSDMEALLAKYGTVTVLESKYNTFRGSRNLKNRKIHVKEYLFILEKNVF